MHLYAPAKINWTLEVLGRPKEYQSYHQIITVLQAIDLRDEIELERSPELRLEVQGPHEPGEDDLVLRAARLLAQEAGGAPKAHIRLSKRIPVASGLGGGSSDAAAVLRGLSELWELGYSRARLAELGAGLGSDVPFFVYGGTALAEGRGERITPLPDAREQWLVLVAPPLSLAYRQAGLPEKTKRMYESLRAAEFSDGSRTQALVERIRRGEPIEEGCLHNIFERVAYTAFAGLAAYRDALLAAGARRAHLAGSGPALFALASDEAAAREMAGRLRLPAGEVIVARTIGAEEALRAEP